MDWLDAPELWAARWIYHRGVGLAYLLAFVNARNQFRPLLGDHGLLPVSRYLERTRFWQAPSVFHLGYRDSRLAAVAWTGIALAAGAVLGLPDRLPALAGLAWWLSLWALYQSIVNVGQRFYSFGWESLLLEAGFLAAFLGPADMAPPATGLVLVWWLLFRVEFGAGLIKIRGDRCWRDLTCLRYHHETQPMPNPLSWWFHRLPMWMHRAEVAANHVTQLAMPWLLIAPQPARGVAAAVIVVTQAWLMLSGNFAWLNLLTLVLGLTALSPEVLAVFTPAPTPMTAMPGWHAALALAVFGLYCVLAWAPVKNLLSRRQLMNASFNPLHLGNTYGAFGSITRERYEIVIEGSADPGDPGSWRPYAFKGKPGDPRRRPRQWAPYHLRLDWLMWFAALSPSYAQGWFDALLDRLLEGDAATRSLLAHDPFGEHPPVAVRAVRYRYRYSTRAERRADGAWWVREPAGRFAAPRRRASS